MSAKHVSAECRFILQSNENLGTQTAVLNSVDCSLNMGSALIQVILHNRPYKFYMQLSGSYSIQ